MCSVVRPARCQVRVAQHARYSMSGAITIRLCPAFVPQSEWPTQRLGEIHQRVILARMMRDQEQARCRTETKPGTDGAHRIQSRWQVTWTIPQVRWATSTIWDRHQINVSSDEMSVRCGYFSGKCAATNKAIQYVAPANLNWKERRQKPQKYP